MRVDFKNIIVSAVAAIAGVAMSATSGFVVSGNVTGDRINYPEFVRNRPQLKGVMLGSTTEKDFKDLSAMGATLVRFQMHENWNRFGGTNEVERFNAWIDLCLGNLERMMEWGRKYGVKICVDLHTSPGGYTAEKHRSCMMFAERKYEDLFVATWEKIARRIKGNADVIYGYDLINEPIDRENRLTKTTWRAVMCRAIAAVRKIDPDTPIVVEPNCHASPRGYDVKNVYGLMGFKPLPYDNLIYSVHIYVPMDYTHQGLSTKKENYKPRPYPGRGRLLDPNRRRYAGDIGGNDESKDSWDKDFLRREIQSVRDFQMASGAKIFVGEFSAVAYAPGAEVYLSDLCELFEEYGWDWTYHAFRESTCWSLEHEGASFYELKPAKEKTLRAKVIERFLKPCIQVKHRVGVRAGENLLDVQKQVRRFLKENPGVGVDVVLESGEYRLPEGIEFTSRDSGVSSSGIVTWRAKELGGAKLVGGVNVPASQFRVVSDPVLLKRLRPEVRKKVFVADVSGLIPGDLPDFPSGFATPPPPVVFIDSSIGTLARWPNEGYVSFSIAVDRGKKTGNMYTGGAFVFDDPRPGEWDFNEGVWLNGYWTHDWCNCSVKAAGWKSEDGKGRVMRLAGAIPYGVKGGTWGNANRRFYAFNVFEELDAPGEWWLDRSRKLLYVCSKDGVVPEVVLSMSQLALLRGRGAGNLRFCGLSVECGYAGLVDFSSADGVVFEDCRLQNTARRGVALSGRRCRIARCDVSGCGGCAVTIGGGDRKTLTRSDNIVENCRIHDFGIYQRTYAPGICLEYSVGAIVRGNEIFDAPHSACLYMGNDNLFESNDVHHVLMETGDAGAFYTGRDWTTQGNVLRFNRVHDLGGGTVSGYGGKGDVAVAGANTMGFYFDDCDCGDAVYSNEFRNVARGIMVGGGRDHPIVGNVFSNCVIGLSIDCRGMTWKNWNTKDGGWNLEEKAQKLDYTNGVWAARYPRLANIMNDHPREPLYNPVISNTFIDCAGALLVLDKCAPLERMAPIKDNVVIYTESSGTVRRAKIDTRVADGFIDQAAIRRELAR